MLENFLFHKSNNLVIVGDFSGNNPVKQFAVRVGRAMRRDVVFASTNAIDNIYNPLLNDKVRFNNDIANVIKLAQEAEVVHLHLELGMYGNTLDDMRKNIFDILKCSKKLVLFVHSFHINDTTFAPLYLDIINYLNNAKHTSKTKIWVNNVKDFYNIKQIYNGEIIYYPVMYFSNKLRRYFYRYSKTCLKSNEFTDIGMFGYINAHKDFETAIKTLALLPNNYRLHIVGGAHPGERQICKRNASIEKLDDLLWKFRDLGVIDRVVFYDKLGDIEFFKTMSKMDIVLVSYLETYMSASSVLSQAYELQKKIVATRCTTFEMAERHFGNAIHFFDPGNSIQLMQTIAKVSESKISRDIEFSLEYFADMIKI